MRWIRFDSYGGARWCPLIGVALDGSLEVLLVPLARCWGEQDRWASLFVAPSLVIGWCESDVSPDELQPESMAAVRQLVSSVDVEGQWRALWAETVPQLRVWVLDQLERAEPYGLFDEELEAAGVSRASLIAARRDLAGSGQVMASSHRLVPPSQAAPRLAWRITRTGIAVLSRARSREVLATREVALAV